MGNLAGAEQREADIGETSPQGQALKPGLPPWAAGAPLAATALGRKQRRTAQIREEREDTLMIEQRIDVGAAMSGSTRATKETMLLTFKEAMEFLRVSRSTIYRLMWSGQLRGHKVGSAWRFYERDLLDAVSTPTMATTAPLQSNITVRRAQGRHGEEA